jgi:hypothetical protein
MFSKKVASSCYFFDFLARACTITASVSDIVTLIRFHENGINPWVWWFALNDSRMLTKTGWVANGQIIIQGFHNTACCCIRETHCLRKKVNTSSTVWRKITVFSRRSISLYKYGAISWSLKVLYNNHKPKGAILIEEYRQFWHPRAIISFFWKWITLTGPLIVFHKRKTSHKCFGTTVKFDMRQCFFNSSTWGCCKTNTLITKLRFHFFHNTCRTDSFSTIHWSTK